MPDFGKKTTLFLCTFLHKYILKNFSSVWKGIESTARSFFRCRFPIKVSRKLESLLVIYLKSKLSVTGNLLNVLLILQFDVNQNCRDNLLE